MKEVGLKKLKLIKLHTKKFAMKQIRKMLFLILTYKATRRILEFIEKYLPLGILKSLRNNW